MSKLITVFLSLLLSIQVANASYETLGNPKLAYNCVFYARSIVDSLPRGLYTLRAKLKIINSSTPEVGAVIIIKTKYYAGHVGYVKIVEDNMIWIEEGNYKGGRVTTRWLDIDDKSIMGYYFDSDLLNRIQISKKVQVALDQTVETVGRYASFMK